MPENMTSLYADNRANSATKRLNSEQIEQFFDEGYLIVPNLFTPTELEPLQEEIDAIVERTSRRLYQEGRISHLHDAEGFETRLARLLSDTPDLANTFFRELEGKGGGGHTGPEMFRLLTHSTLLDAMEDLLGSPEIIASSIYRIRPKVPHLGRGVVPWHQDSGYISPRCDQDLIITCWIPLVDATVENGCLWVLPRTHTREVVRHHTGGNAGFLVIADDDLPAPPDNAIPVPVPLGGALLLTNRTPHCSTPNTSEMVRWSVDLRYQGKEVPNNIAADIDNLMPDAPEITIACYPPEGDFIVRSLENPGSVADFAEFVRRRDAFEKAPIGGPDRRWSPLSQRPESESSLTK